MRVLGRPVPGEGPGRPAGPPVCTRVPGHWDSDLCASSLGGEPRGVAPALFSDTRVSTFPLDQLLWHGLCPQGRAGALPAAPGGGRRCSLHAAGGSWLGEESRAAWLGWQRQGVGRGEAPTCPEGHRSAPRQAGALAVPRPAQAGCAGDSKDQHLVTVLAAPWQPARERQHAGTPRRRTGSEVSPVYGIPHSRPQPHTLRPAPPATSARLQGGSCPFGTGRVTRRSPPLTLPSLDCCLCAKREEHTETGRPGPGRPRGRGLSQAAACGQRSTKQQ